MTDREYAIKPYYSATRANESVYLGQDTVYIACDGHELTCPGEARLHLQPRLRLTLTANFSAEPENGLRLGVTERRITLRYGSHGRSVPVLMADADLYGGPSGWTSCATFIPNPERLTICQDRRKWLSAVTFHVMNFPAFLSQGKQATDLLYELETGRAQRLGRVVLEHEGWRIELQTLPQARDLIKQLQTEGGFAITHVGRLTCKDKSSFRIAQSEALLSDLHQFLSFARGLWVAPVLPVGVDAAGNRIYEEWGSRLTTAWEPRVSWFDENNGQALPELFSGFMDLLHDPALGDSVKAALYWYLRSNRAGEGAGVDSGVILSQASLERLTMAYLTKTGLQTNDGVKDRLRRAFDRLGLPMAVPKNLGAISTGYHNKDWCDLPEAVVEVRNELIHPKERLKTPVGKVVPTVWRIAQRYIELSFLALAGFQGLYSNRLSARWRGQVERVPWAR